MTVRACPRARNPLALRARRATVYRRERRPTAAIIHRHDRPCTDGGVFRGRLDRRATIFAARSRARRGRLDVVILDDRLHTHADDGIASKESFAHRSFDDPWTDGTPPGTAGESARRRTATSR
jgi:hypothetical protein